MPFTPSHAALALPFVRTPLLPAAVVIGTVTPDLPYFLPFPTFRELTHAIAGVPTIDLAIGLVAFGAWRILRAPVIDLAPAWLRSRMRGSAASVDNGWRDGRTWIGAIALVVASLLVGIATHLLWDSFTHPGWLVDHVAALRTQLGPLPLEKWLQHASSVGGLVALGIWTALWVRRTPRGTDVAVVGSRARTTVWLAVVAVFVVSGLVTWGIGIRSGIGALDPTLVFLVARVSVGLTIAVALVGCVSWICYRAIYKERRTATTLPRTSA